MKQKTTALLLVLAMVMSLFAGQQYQKTEVQAAQEDEMVLGSLVKAADGTYYTYPDADVKLSDASKTFYNLSITVDSGHIMTPVTQIGGVTGKGIVVGTDMNVGYTDLTATERYESILFEFASGASEGDIETFVRQLRFTTSNNNQKVAICATTHGNGSTTQITVDGETVDLKYFNGHYYGFVPKVVKWTDAYKTTKSLKFNGVQGYLMTLTSRAEDRFILTSFPISEWDATKAKAGWMGCTRAILADGSSYTDEDTQWQPLKKFEDATKEEFAWRWVSGPETGTTFGYQTTAYGYGTGDGGFETAEGQFSNWSTEGNIEPNGGGVTDEAFGFYGKYIYGRWNDNPDSSYEISGYYIEFGGYPGDEAKIEDNLGQVIVAAEETTNEIITDGSYTDTPKPTPTANSSATPTANSSATPTATATASPEATKIPIRDEVKIVNTTTDKSGNEIVKEGTVLKADASGVNPQESHDSLTYQWYQVDDEGKKVPIAGATGSNYTLTSEDVGQKFVVEVTGNGNYYGTLASNPYEAKRTDADITIDQPQPSGSATPAPDSKMTIVVNPTIEDYVYTLQKADGTQVTPGTEMVVKDKDGNTISPDSDGYYEQPAGGMIQFSELDKDETYVIVKKKKDETTGETSGVVGPTIEDVKTEYDDNKTEDKKDDTIEIIVDPALSDSVYAIRKWEDGKWNDIPIVKDSDGKWIPDSSLSGDKVWTDANETIVTFSKLPADGTYKVVAKSKDGNITDITPDEIIGGSGDIKVERPETPVTATPTPAVSQAPSASIAPEPTAAPVTVSFAPEVEKKADTFIKDYFTDTNGKIITTVTDLTRDKIVSGETVWKTLTTVEKQAVNQLIKEKGGKYTYEQLLKKAKAYKIPGFKVIKFMQKKTKAKLKLIKCKGAKIVCTSTNKKVATIDKKGVISAKKPGRATVTFTAMKGKYTNRLVIDVRVKKKFKNAKELSKFSSKVIKTPTVLVAKKRLLKKTSRIDVYDLEKTSKVQYKPIKKKILTINKKGKYTGKKRGSTLVQVKINQNKKVYLLYVYVTIY